MIKITLENGSPYTFKVTNTEDGQDITNILGARKVEILIVPDTRPIAKIEAVISELDLDLIPEEVTIEDVAIRFLNENEEDEMDLNGIWKVKVTSGPLWFRSFNWFRDRKIIKGESGYNVASGIKWGKFTISKEDEEIILTYIKQPIIDKIRFVDNDRLSGKFYFKKNHIGNFDMMRTWPLSISWPGVLRNDSL